jgi:hypothetical protein
MKYFFVFIHFLARKRHKKEMPSVAKAMEGKGGAGGSTSCDPLV